MSNSDILDIVIGVAVIGYVLYMQLQVRPIRSMRTALILGVIGVIELVQYLGKGHHSASLALALGGSLVLAAVLGAVRAATVRIWVENGQALRQGNWLTVVLWLVSIGVHLGYDYLVAGKSLGGLGSASLLLYMAVTFGVQAVVMQIRAQRIGGLAPAGPGPRFPRP